jgi:uncharacterized YigZ family protein
MDTVYFTVARKCRWEQKIERSLFIGQVSSVTTSEEAQAFVGQIKEEHTQATHNCFAYRVGCGEHPVTYFNDHGEPSGTAGRPILNAILRTDLTNTVVVVTRYFGGKKLGIRGLIDAYHSTALQTLEQAGRSRLIPSFALVLNVSYPQLAVVNHLLQTYEAKILDEKYATSVHLKVSVPQKFHSDLTSALTGLVEVQWDEA